MEHSFKVVQTENIFIQRLQLNTAFKVWQSELSWGLKEDKHGDALTGRGHGQRTAFPVGNVLKRPLWVNSLKFTFTAELHFRPLGLLMKVNSNNLQRGFFRCLRDAVVVFHLGQLLIGTLIRPQRNPAKLRMGHWWNSFPFPVYTKQRKYMSEHVRGGS